MRANIATLLVLTLLAPTVACDSADEGDDQVQAQEFVDGMEITSDDGAFSVTLWSESGNLEVGTNDLKIRLGFADPSKADESMPIPNATIALDAYMADADVAMGSEPTVTYLGRGEYSLENVMLGEDGVWNFDFVVSIGDGVQEAVTLAFVVE